MIKGSAYKDDQLANLYIGKAIRSTMEKATRDPDMTRERGMVWAILKERFDADDWAIVRDRIGWEAEPSLLPPKPIDRSPVYARDFMSEPTPPTEIIALVLIGAAVRAFLDTPTTSDPPRGAWDIVIGWIETGATDAEFRHIQQETGFITAAQYEDLTLEASRPARPVARPGAGPDYYPRPRG